MKLLRIVCGLLVLAKLFFPRVSNAAVYAPLHGTPDISQNMLRRLLASLILHTLFKAELATHYLVFVVARLRGVRLSPPPVYGGGSRSTRSAADAVGEWFLIAPTRSEPHGGSIACLPHKWAEAEALNSTDLARRLNALKEVLENLEAAAERSLLSARDKVSSSSSSSAKWDYAFSSELDKRSHPSAPRNEICLSVLSLLESKKGGTLLVPP